MGTLASSQVLSLAIIRASSVHKCLRTHCFDDGCWNAPLVKQQNVLRALTSSAGGQLAKAAHFGATHHLNFAGCTRHRRSCHPPVAGSAPQHSCAHTHTYAVMQSCACWLGQPVFIHIRVGLYHMTRRYVPECEVSLVWSQQSVPNQCKTNVTALAHSCNVYTRVLQCIC